MDPHRAEDSRLPGSERLRAADDGPSRRARAYSRIFLVGIVIFVIYTIRKTGGGDDIDPQDLVSGIQGAHRNPVSAHDLETMRRYFWAGIDPAERPTSCGADTSWFTDIRQRFMRWGIE